MPNSQITIRQDIRQTSDQFHVILTSTTIPTKRCHISFGITNYRQTSKLITYILVLLYKQFDFSNVIEFKKKHLSHCLSLFNLLLLFLAHLAKGNVSFCHHLSSVVR